MKSGRLGAVRAWLAIVRTAWSPKRMDSYVPLSGEIDKLVPVYGDDAHVMPRGAATTRCAPPGFCEPSWGAPRLFCSFGEQVSALHRSLRYVS